MTKIEVKNLSFAYDKQHVLTDISFQIKNNSINVLLGLNGSGKTTLIKLLTRILVSREKNIYINDKEISTISQTELSKYLAYVPQNISEDNDFTVKDYLTFGRMNRIKFYSMPQQKDYEQALSVAQELGLETLLYKKMNELSGGQRQLVVIARSVVQDSDIILMDEPTSSIDYKYLDKFIRYLQILQKRGKTIIFSCHNPSVPLLLNANIIVLEQGLIKFTGNARDILTLENMRSIYGCELIPCVDLPYTEFSILPI